MTLLEMETDPSSSMLSFPTSGLMAPDEELTESSNNAEISDDETQADSSRTMPEAVEKEELGGWAGSALIDKLLEPEKGEK